MMQAPPQGSDQVYHIGLNIVLSDSQMTFIPSDMIN